MTNLLTVLEIGLTTGLILTLLVYALSVAYRIFDFPDLTVEGSFLFGAAIFASAFKADFGFIWSFGLACVGGFFLGSLTGFLHSKFDLNKFLTAIIVVAISYSLSLRVMSGPNIGLINASLQFESFASSSMLSDFLSGGFLFYAFIDITTLSLVVLLLKSKAGLKLRVAGCNPCYAKTLGINVVFSNVLALGLTNSLSSLSGALFSLHQGFSDIGMLNGTLIIALASLSIGERILPERYFSYPAFVMVSALVGSVVYQTIIAFSVNMGVNPIDLKLLTAVIVLLVVIIRNKSDGLV